MNDFGSTLECTKRVIEGKLRTIAPFERQPPARSLGRDFKQPCIRWKYELFETICSVQNVHPKRCVLAVGSHVRILKTRIHRHRSEFRCPLEMTAASYELAKTWTESTTHARYTNEKDVVKLRHQREPVQSSL